MLTRAEACEVLTQVLGVPATTVIRGIPTKVPLDTDDGLLIQAVTEDAVLSNTQLRWFRQRRADTGSAEMTNVIAFTLIAAPPAQAELPLGGETYAAA